MDLRTDWQVHEIKSDALRTAAKEDGIDSGAGAPKQDEGHRVTFNESVGPSGRYTYTPEETQKFIYNLPPHDRVKLQRCVDRRGGWVKEYNHLVNTYGADGINAIMNGGTAHFRRGYSSAHSYPEHAKERVARPSVKRPLGTQGNHTIQLSQAKYSRGPLEGLRPAGTTESNFMYHLPQTASSRSYVGHMGTSEPENIGFSLAPKISWRF